jgi:hypothetical protein
MRFTWRLFMCMMGDHSPSHEWKDIFAGKQIRECVNCGKIVEERSGRPIQRQPKLK